MELQLLDLSNYPIGGSYCIEQSNLWPWNSFLFEQLSKNTLHSHLEPSEILNSQLFGETWCPSHAAAGDGSSLHCFSPPHCPGELSEGCEAWQELQPCAPSSSWAQRQRFCIFLWQFPPIQSDQRIGGRLHTCLTTEKEICWGKNVCFYSSRGVNLPMFIWEWCVSRTHRLEMLHALLHHPIIRRQLERSGCLKKGECLHFLRDGCATVSTVSSETPSSLACCHVYLFPSHFCWEAMEGQAAGTPGVHLSCCWWVQLSDGCRSGAGSFWGTLFRWCMWWCWLLLIALPDGGRLRSSCFPCSLWNTLKLCKCQQCWWLGCGGSEF